MILDQPFEHPILTDWDSVDDGLQFKQCVKDRIVDTTDPLQQYVVSDDETETTELLAQFSPKQRKRILRYGYVPQLYFLSPYIWFCSPTLENWPELRERKILYLLVKRKIRKKLKTEEFQKKNILLNEEK